MVPYLELQMEPDWVFLMMFAMVMSLEMCLVSLKDSDLAWSLDAWRASRMELNWDQMKENDLAS